MACCAPDVLDEGQVMWSWHLLHENANLLFWSAANESIKQHRKHRCLHIDCIQYTAEQRGQIPWVN